MTSIIGIKTNIGDEGIVVGVDTQLNYSDEDKKGVRVTGPFTVESLSPHRFVSLEEEKPAAEKTAKQESSEGQFEAMIL